MFRFILLLLLFAGIAADWISQPWTKELYDKYDNILMSCPGGLCFQKGVFASKDDIKDHCINATRSILPDQVNYNSVCTFTKLGKSWFDPSTARKCSTYCLWLESMDESLNCTYTYMRDECGPRCEKAVKDCGTDATPTFEITPASGTTPAPETTLAPETTPTLETALAKGPESTESGKNLKTTESSENNGNNLMHVSTWIATMVAFLAVLIF